MEEQNNKPLSFNELLNTNKEYQAEYDRKVNEAIEKSKAKAKAEWEEDYKKRMEEEKSEAEKVAKMKEAERHQYELDTERKAKDEAIAELNAYKMREQVYDRAKEKGLDVSLLGDLNFKTLKAEDVDSIIDSKKSIFDKALENAINERFKEKTPTNIVGDSVSDNRVSSEFKLNPMFRNFN